MTTDDPRHIPSADATQQDVEFFDVVIVGAGISGLATAWYLKRANPALTFCVLERGDVGGKIATTEIAGVRVDCGPDAFLARVEGGVELARELGLADELVAPATGKAYVWSRNRLRALPDGLVLGVPTQLRSLAQSGICSPWGVARAAWDEVRPERLTQLSRTRHHDDDPSVAVAIGRRLGKEVVDRLVDPLLGGINASDCQTLSLASAAPNLVAASKQPNLMRALRSAQATQQRGAIGSEVSVDERPVFLAPRTGIRTLIDRMYADLRHHIRTNVEVKAIERLHDRTVIDTSAGRVEATYVVMATPAATTAALLRHVNPVATNELINIRTSSVALTLLTYPEHAIDLPPGSGMLVPRVENRFITASSWWNHKWPHLATPGQVLLRASAGRDGDDRFQDMTDREVIDRLHTDLAAMLPIRSRPSEAVVTRWPNGFPQYDTGHAARVDRIERALAATTPHIAVTGASYRGIGIPACIRDAKATAARIAANLPD
jgi:protoporphyrinogen/coproporphyrinogen III oxidase